MYAPTYSPLHTLAVLFSQAQRMEVSWIRFANDVGEAYMTYPPRGHGNELGTQELASDYLEEGKLYAD